MGDKDQRSILAFVSLTSEFFEKVQHVLCNGSHISGFEDLHRL